MTEPDFNSERVHIRDNRFRLLDGGHCYLDAVFISGGRLEVNRMPARIQPDDLAAFVRFLAKEVEANQPDRP